MEVIEAARWDSEPVRGLLIALLGGELQVVGDLKQELIAAEHAGLIEFSPDPGFVCGGKGRTWHVKHTLVGQSLAVRIGSSTELCEVLDCSLSVRSDDWQGVHPGVVFDELDLRDGGAGRVRNWMVWSRARGREYVQQLPRRLDTGSAPS